MFSVFRIFSLVFIIHFLILLIIFSLPSQAEIKQNQIEPYYGSEQVNEIYKGPKIIVNVAARQLKLYDEKNDLIKVYPIAVGMNGYRTPLGKRKMVQIVWNPWWIPPKGRTWTIGENDMPPGPKNPLGPVKMNLERAILFHGTNKPDTVGYLRSHGCIRLYSEDASELAKWIQERVTDLRSPDLFEEYQKNNHHSFYVRLDQPVPVDIVYDTVEIRDDELHIFQDVYYKINDQFQIVKEKLMEAGYNIKKIDLGFIQQQIQQSKNKEDLKFKITELLLSNRKKNMATGH